MANAEASTAASGRNMTVLRWCVIDYSCARGAKANGRRGTIVPSLLDRLDRHRDNHVVGGRGLVLRHAEFRALDARSDFGPARRLLGCRMDGAFEVRDRQRDRPGDTAHRQLAFTAHEVLAVELQVVRLEGDGRKLGDVEIVLALEHRFARWAA